MDYELKTPENYLKLLNDALRIPSGPDWNYRFRKELKAKGLTLSMSIKDEEKVFYPNEFPVVAPLSYDLNDGWPKESLIVWEDTQ